MGRGKIPPFPSSHRQPRAYNSLLLLLLLLLLCTVNDLINARGVYLISGVQNSRISTPSIDTTRPSKDPYYSFKSQHRYQNTSYSGVTVLPSLLYAYFEIDIKQDEIHKALFMLTKQEP